MNHDEVIDRLGADNWEQVAECFEGIAGREAVLAKLDTIFELDDNRELAEALSDALDHARAAAGVVADALEDAANATGSGHEDAARWRRRALSGEADGDPDTRMVVLARSVRRLLYREALDASPEDRADLDARIAEIDALWK